MFKAFDPVLEFSRIERLVALFSWGSNVSISQAIMIGIARDCRQAAVID